MKQIRRPYEVESELSRFEHSPSQQNVPRSEVLGPPLRMAMIVGVGLAVAQQVTGINQRNNR